MIESASIAIGSRIGAELTTGVYLAVRLFRRNGNSKASSPGVSAETVRQELHDRVSDEVSAVREEFVRKEVCSIVREGLEKDITAIRTGVEKLVRCSEEE